MWVKFVVMGFTRTAAFWLQSMDFVIKDTSWKDLCKVVCARFEKDQHNYLLRQFLQIKQLGSVSEYIELFDELMHQIKAHDPSFDVALINNKFIDGLKPEIKSVVLMHKPMDLDTPSSLALLQEELTMGYPWKDNIRVEAYHGGLKLSSRPSSSTTPSTRALTFSSLEEKQHAETLKIQPLEDKMNAIKAFRRAKGLCFKCGLKWAPNHKCAPIVSLHVVEELWQLLQDFDSGNVTSFDNESDFGDDLMSISLHAIDGTSAVWQPLWKKASNLV